MTFVCSVPFNKNCLNLKHRYLRKVDLAQGIIVFQKLHFNKSASNRQKLLNQNKTCGPGTRLARSIDEPGFTANMLLQPLTELKRQAGQDLKQSTKMICL